MRKFKTSSELYPLALHLPDVILTQVFKSSVNSTTTLFVVVCSQVIDPTTHTFPAKGLSFLVPMYCKSTLKEGITVIVGLGVTVLVGVCVAVMLGVCVAVEVCVLVLVAVAIQFGKVLTL